MTNNSVKLELPVRADPVQTLRKALLEGLHSGKWPPGTRLPTERSLCTSFGVSRFSLRRVLQELREQGLIVQKVGSGTYVSEALAEPLRPACPPEGVPSLPSASPAEIMEARLLLEPTIIDLVVSNATSSDFEELESCCARAEAADTLEEFEHWDNALHERLAQATHNAVLISAFKMLSTFRSSAEWGFLKKKMVTPERRKEYEAEHRRLVQALKQRDAETARRELFEHLVHARTNLLGRI
ncbi:FCD domain-containing protein [uncultured Pigmentiphaga sp.]|uniref:FadR/GntR family transcriptional regulator n=1 Tax=uncultured Pigmentiphaga sp. TaxID=340361 RepID=UPI00262A31FF|nr:FCD domain-containing protein [uncultured Pigmentiphaga sp.]